MRRRRTPIESAAGKLVSAIQKEWGDELGQPASAVSEEVMHASHALLQAAAREGSIASVIGRGTIASFLGIKWVETHPKVLPYIQAVETLELRGTGA